jgi:hypothetical protein
MRIVLALLAALALAGTARADLGVVTIPAAEDLSLPFWCDWGYEWQERCFRDDSDRLPIGGVDDKVWRAGLQFSLDALPAGAEVFNAELSLSFDGVCVAPRRTLRPCETRAFRVEAHPILTARWPVERLIQVGPLVDSASVDAAHTGRLVWDLSGLVSGWASGDVENHGVLLQLADEQEAFGSSGPALPSSSYADPGLRPRLTLWFVE